MTQTEFYEMKEWVENVTGLVFYDDQVMFDTDGCRFIEYIGGDTLSLCVNNDRSTELQLLRKDESDLEIYATNPENIHIGMDIFAHIVHNN